METIRQIERKFGCHETEKLLKEYDIAGSLDVFTQGQGKALLKFKNLDALRTRIIEEGYARVHPENAGDAARLFGVGPPGAMPAMRVGKYRRFELPKVLKWLASKEKD